MKTDAQVRWPADRVAAYIETGCWRGEPIGSLLWQWAERSGERIAVVDGDVRLSYNELAVRADALAERLTARGLACGDSVLMQLPNSWEFVVVTLACIRAGIAPVMMLPSHREYELGSIGAHVGAKAVIVPDRWRYFDHQDLAHHVAAMLPGPVQVLVVGDDVRATSVDVRALLGTDGDAAARRRRLDASAPASSDVALFLLSGGTTGVPKLIGRTHDDYDYNIRCCADACAVDEETVYLTALPAGHNFPLANPGILGTLYRGGRVVMAPSPRPTQVFDLIERERVTMTSAVPAVALKWVAHAVGSSYDISSLRTLHVGGSILAPTVAATIATTLNCQLQQVYGMAEGLICYTPPNAPDHIAHHTQGKPISPHDELKIIDPHGNPQPPGHTGELLTRGPYTPPGYHGAPQQNATSYTPDGWYRTGDLVHLTTDGNIVVTGRVKDLINRAGEKISAGEVESLVQEIPAVAEAAAVAVPDADVGERVCLFVRLHAGATLELEDVVRALTARGLAAFKIPERMIVLDDLPHTAVGKPDKKALRLLVSKPTPLP
ncbi:(2,3-dihydroxybenzoyl)adenylate synthase [Dactylosporangium sp. CA-152071]|uniref:(2,3-dihydroxybenzoyl)adenylate synthase n=1 Tax=Dactylosporangium sp. CA-152071 TaxID=3239933 RepID=UPI003D8E8FEC